MSYQEQRMENYHNIIVENLDQDYFDPGAKDPKNYMDKHTQKLEINPGIGFKSTSHDDVFEIRNKLENSKAI